MLVSEKWKPGQLPQLRHQWTIYPETVYSSEIGEVGKMKEQRGFCFILVWFKFLKNFLLRGHCKCGGHMWGNGR